ncbi:MAG: hypothetical protein K6A31_09940 [Fibrobacter sp.]|nr:hypothetical protein [Fibrobacter sp.]
MKKFIVPAVLLVLAIALFAFLKADPFQPKLDGARYLSLREEIDEADMAVFAAADDPDEKMVAIAHRDSLWGVLVAMRNLESNASAPAPVKAPAKASVKAKESSVEKEGSGTNVFVFIIGGLIALIVIGGVVFFILRNRQEAITRQLEQIRKDNRFKTPKGGLDDPTFVDRTRVHRRSIIDDAKQSDETLASSQQESTLVTTDDVEFENAKGEVEHPVLRPTAKQRITKAMQSLSDTLAGLAVPKGIHRDPDKVQNVRAQSHNTMKGTAIPKPNPLEMTRFDRERQDKERVIQLNRRGYTPAEIARRTQLSEEQVETVIRVKRETGE